MGKLDKPPAAKPSLEQRAKQHPEFAKWEALAGVTEATNPEDAMEHLAKTPEERAFLRAKLYWLQRALGQDESGFRDTGQYRQRARYLADRLNLQVAEVEKIYEDAREEVDSSFGSLGGTKGRRLAEKEIEKLELEIGQEAA